MPYKYQFDESDHFLFHGKAYLRTARLCLFQIIENKYNWSDENDRVPESFRPIPYTVDNLLPPALFCIQHGIEVSLKSCLFDSEIKFRSNHKTIELYEVLKKHVLETKWRKITINGWQVLIEAEEVKRIKSSVFEELDYLIEYFYFNDLLSEKLNRPRSPDPQNEIFRYPKSLSGDDYDVMDLSEKITDDDIKELIRKLDKVSNHLLDIGYLIGESKAYKNATDAVFEEIES